MSTAWDKSDLYNAIVGNDSEKVHNLLVNASSDGQLLSTAGENYLHLAVQQGASPQLVKELLPNVPLGRQ